MSDEIKELHDTLKSIEPKKAVQAIIGESKPKEPRQSRHNRRMPYYRKRFALQIQTIIDQMIAEHKTGVHEDRFFAYAAYENVLSKNSLYLKINQSLLYLRCELDPTGIYGEFYEMIMIKRMEDGIRLTYQRDIIEGKEADLVATKVLPLEEQKVVYRTQIDKFIEEGKAGEQLIITKLHLSQEEIDNIEASICQLDNIVSKIHANRIWMAKTE